MKIDTDQKRLTPLPCSRNLIVGSVGSGKSTVGATLLEWYHAFHPTHSIYIIDPKRRFIPIRDDSAFLFPEGVSAKNHGRVNGVSVNARLLTSVPLFVPKEPVVYLIHSQGLALRMFDWLFKHSNVRRPVLIYNDESLDIHRGNLVDYRFKRIIQMGREKGLGHVTINQRPKRIDTTLISESDRLYVGNLNNVNDRIALAETANLRDAKKGIG